jgi:hypothetical protein
MTNRNVSEDDINSNNSCIRNEYKRLQKDQTLSLPKRNQQPGVNDTRPGKNKDSTQLHDVFSFNAVILKSGVHFFRNQNFTPNGRGTIMLTLFKKQNCSHLSSRCMPEFNNHLEIK